MLNGEELIRWIDTLHHEKDIDKEVLFDGIETALLTAVLRKYGEREELAIEVDRETGEIIAWDGEEEADDIDLNELGRIAAQTAKQVIIQRIRDAERDVIYDDYEDKVNAIVSGTVQRIEAGNVIVNLSNKAEGVIPRHEKVRNELYNPGDRIKAVIYDVKKVGPKVKIMLSRTTPEIVKKLFELEVPEISDKVIEIKNIAREPGFRTKIAVSSIDARVDCIGACVGIRGSRIRSITDELGGEKIDIIRWSESLDELVMNSLRPAQISNIEINEETKEIEVTVPDDQLSLAIGKKGQNVRLASRLTGYEIKLQSPGQAVMSRDGGGERDAAVDAAHEALLGDDPTKVADPEGKQETDVAKEGESEPAVEVEVVDEQSEITAAPEATEGDAEATEESDAPAAEPAEGDAEVAAEPEESDAEAAEGDAEVTEESDAPDAEATEATEATEAAEDEADAAAEPEESDAEAADGEEEIVTEGESAEKVTSDDPESPSSDSEEEKREVAEDGNVEERAK